MRVTDLFRLGGQAPAGTVVATAFDGSLGGVYVSCQWGGCDACEPHPPYEPPEGWGTWTGDWFCPPHLVAAALEDTEWIVGVPDAREPSGMRVSEHRLRRLR